MMTCHAVARWDLRNDSAQHHQLLPALTDGAFLVFLVLLGIGYILYVRFKPPIKTATITPDQPETRKSQVVETVTRDMTAFNPPKDAPASPTPSPAPAKPQAKPP